MRAYLIFIVGGNLSRSRRGAEQKLIFPHPVLVCDIGGTNTRVAVVSRPGEVPAQIGTVATSSHSDLLATIKPMQERAKVRARSLIVSAAGPLDGKKVHLTNAAWSIDGPKIGEALGLDQGMLLNDFEAQAVALPHLPDRSVRAICDVAADPLATRLVLGPGTGLGAAALLRAQDRWLPVTTEAGHAGFGPSDAFEERLWPHLERVSGRVTFESVLSGPGLARVYAALRKVLGMPAQARTAAEVGAAAKEGEDAANACLRLFWRLVARCAGDLALAFLPRGGVTLAGGVLPRLVDWLDVDEFRSAFIDKAPMSALLSAMPVRLVMDPDAALTGLAALAADPYAYALDYASRAWRT